MILSQLLLLASTLFASPPDAVHHLRVALAMVDSQGVRQMRLRNFEDSSGRPWMLTLDPNRLRTSVRSAMGWMDFPDSVPGFDSSSWARLQRSERIYGIRGAGLSHLLNKERGIVLSVDLCPSHRPFDRRLVRRVWEAFQSESKPIPVAFALSGAWLRNHGTDLDWLRSQIDSGHIQPTWINHTDNHAYIKGRADRRNFLMLPGTDLVAEVLGAEAEMIRRGLTPSVFFRFPGLVDTDSLFLAVLATGLLPVGSDAWLAKNQPATSGSIVLVHGNGNEKLGVDGFLRLLTRHKREIRRQTWHLKNLPEELEAETLAVPPAQRNGWGGGARFAE